MKNLIRIAALALVATSTAYAGGGSSDRDDREVHCEWVKSEECHSSNAGTVCQPVFRKICLPVSSGRGGNEPLPGGG